MDKPDADRMSRRPVAEARAMYRRMLSGWCRDYLAFRAAFGWRVRPEHPAEAMPTSVLDD